MKLIYALLLVLFTKEISGNYLQPITDEFPVEKFTQHLINIINYNEKIRVDLTSIFIIDSTKYVDTDKIIKRLTENNDIIIDGIINDGKITENRIDYLLILHDHHHERMAEKYFDIFNDKHYHLSTKVIVVSFYASYNEFQQLSYDISTKAAMNLFHIGCYNVLLIHTFNGKVIKWKMEIDDSGRKHYTEISLNDYSFPMFPTYKGLVLISQFNDPPKVYVDDDGQLSGVEGKFIDEFCKRTEVNYSITSFEYTTGNTVNEITDAITSSHITIVKNFASDYKNVFENVWLHETDGLCLLVPRNIPVTSLEALSLPFDTNATLLLMISIIFIIIMWKIMNRNISILKILFNVFEIIIGRSVKYENMRLREIFVILPFIFMEIILISLYQSWVISFMIAKPSMRSIQSIEELNNSNTKLNRFYYESDLKINPDNIIEMFSVKNGTFSNTIPDNFDKNLAYLVSCEYADYFIKSPLNFHDRVQLFDKMQSAILTMQTAYIVTDAFSLKKEFKFLVEALRESGMRDYWIKIANEELMKINADEIEDVDKIDWDEIKFPLKIIGFGSIVALFVLLMEVLINLIKKRNSRKIKKEKMRRIRGRTRSNVIHPFVA